jgi:hypothetical protein
MLRGVKSKTAPAGADLNYPVTGFELELLAKTIIFCD